jgi:hypothetical protein
MHEKVEGIGPAIEEWKQTSRITERPIFRPINKMSSRTALDALDKNRSEIILLLGAVGKSHYSVVKAFNDLIRLQAA